VSQRRIDPASVRASLCDPFRVPADAPTPAQVDAVCGQAAVNWIEGERRARLIVSRDLEVMWMNGAARALSDDGEEFGLERLVDLFAGSNSTADGLLKAVMGAIRTWSSEREQGDDITLVALATDEK
jgi:hypothetical protein